MLVQTALPTDGLERKERWLRKHVVEACQRVAQDRNRIWDAAAADFEMLQTVMGDVSQFLAFISRELDETHKMIASTHAELNAMRNGDEDDEDKSRRASGEGSEPAAPYHLTQREETAGGGGGGAKNLLRDFDTLRRQLRTNRIKAGEISLDAHGAALLHVLHLRQREHMRQVCLPILSDWLMTTQARARGCSVPGAGPSFGGTPVHATMILCNVTRFTPGARVTLGSQRRGLLCIRRAPGTAPVSLLLFFLLRAVIRCVVAGEEDPQASAGVDT